MQYRPPRPTHSLLLGSVHELQTPLRLYHNYNEFKLKIVIHHCKSNTKQKNSKGRRKLFYSWSGASFRNKIAPHGAPSLKCHSKNTNVLQGFLPRESFMCFSLSTLMQALKLPGLASYSICDGSCGVKSGVLEYFIGLKA